MQYDPFPWKIPNGVTNTIYVIPYPASAMYVKMRKTGMKTQIFKRRFQHHSKILQVTQKPNIWCHRQGLTKGVSSRDP